MMCQHSSGLLSTLHITTDVAYPFILHHLLFGGESPESYRRVDSVSEVRIALIWLRVEIVEKKPLFQFLVPLLSNAAHLCMRT